MDDQPLKIAFPSMNDLLRAVLGILPNAVIEEDNERQLVIYTGLMELGPRDTPTIPEGETIIVEMP